MRSVLSSPLIYITKAWGSLCVIWYSKYAIITIILAMATVMLHVTAKCQCWAWPVPWWQLIKFHANEHEGWEHLHLPRSGATTKSQTYFTVTHSKISHPQVSSTGSPCKDLTSLRHDGLIIRKNWRVYHSIQETDKTWQAFLQRGLGWTIYYWLNFSLPTLGPLCTVGCFVVSCLTPSICPATKTISWNVFILRHRPFVSGIHQT